MLLQTEIDKLTGTFNDFITDKTCDALSTLLKEPITHKLSMLEDGTNSLKNECLPSDEIKMCSVRLNGKGDLHIELLYTTKLNHGIKIASKLLGTEVNEIDEMGTSALQEVANILTDHFSMHYHKILDSKLIYQHLHSKEGEIKDLIVELFWQLML